MKIYQNMAFLAFFAFLFFAPKMILAQSMLDDLGDEATTERVRYAFKSPRAINGHSMEMLQPGTMDFRILHRFGLLTGGPNEMFGLDQASMRMGFDFGLTPNLMAGFGRSTSKKETDIFGKYRILWQSKGKKVMPISLILVSGATRIGLKDPSGDPAYPPTFARRLGFYNELIIGRKMSEKLTLQIAPMVIHQNLTSSLLQPNTIFATSFAGRWKFKKRIALVWDYAHAFNRFPASFGADPLSLGVDIETGGHVFQLHFSNAVGMNERAFVRDQNASWLDGDVRFGFNLSRVFQISKKRRK